MQNVKAKLGGSVKPPVSSNIDIRDPYDVDFWSVRLRVPPQKLRSAVEAVGPQAEAVTSHLLGSTRGAA